MDHVECYLGQDEFTDHPLAMDGGNAATRVPDLRHLLRFATQNGFEHHVALLRRNHADVVHQAVVRYLGWPICHQGVEPGP